MLLVLLLLSAPVKSDFCLYRFALRLVGNPPASVNLAARGGNQVQLSCRLLIEVKGQVKILLYLSDV